MKKSILGVLMMVLALSFTPNTMTANVTEPTPITTNSPELQARVNTLLLRVDEIKTMDKSSLTRVEKKELRKELKSINTELKASGNGLYLSVGAIIIIILLLILIL